MAPKHFAHIAERYYHLWLYEQAYLYVMWSKPSRRRLERVKA